MDSPQSFSKDKPVVISADNFAKKSNFKYSFVNPKFLGLTTILLLLVMVGGVGTSVYLTQKPQQVVSNASEPQPSLPINTAPSLIPPTTPESPEASSSSSSSADLIFDFNGDLKVNSADLEVINGAWGIPKTDAQKKADINKDGVVNGLDYSLFLPKFQK